jgi:hypothetical protein
MSRGSSLKRRLPECEHVFRKLEDRHGARGRSGAASKIDHELWPREMRGRKIDFWEMVRVKRSAFSLP